ncbi:MAG: hypothetical protein D6775_11375, partial [Caldilineae bacterium]
MRRLSLRLIIVSLSTTLALLGLSSLISALAPDATAWLDPQPSPGDWVTTLPVTAAITAQNPLGLGTDAAYRYSAAGVWSDWSTAHVQVGGVVSTSRRITVTDLYLSEGINFIQYRITDTLGSVAESPALQLNVDTTPPGPPLNVQAQPGSWTNTDSFTVTWTNPADANGIGGVWYKLDAAPSAADDGTFMAGSDIHTLGGVSVGSDGEHTLWLWLADRPGNADPTTAVTVTLRLDTQPPGAVSGQGATPSGWTNTNVFDLSWTAPADPSGITGVRSQLDIPPASATDGTYWPGAVDGYRGYSIPTGIDGEHHLWVWPVDGAGNAARPADAVSITLRLDTTAPPPPLTVPQVSPSGWQTDPQTTYTVTWKNPIDLSGIAAACYKLGQEPQHDLDGTCVAGTNIEQISGVTAPAAGSYHLFLWLQDAAGNIDRASRRVALDAIRWDPTPPEIFIDATGSPGLNGWYVGPIAVNLIASDEGSGLERVEYDLDDAGWVQGQQLTINNEGLHFLRAAAVDVAGNRTEAEPAILNLDMTPPTTQANLNVQPVVDDWYDATVTVNLVPTDDVSGPAYVEWKLDDGFWMRTGTAVVDADGRHLLQYSAADRAGNVESAKSLHINIDRTPPVTSYVILPGEPNEAGWYTQPVSITLVPADIGIGVADTFYRVNGGDWQSGTSFAISASGEYDVEVYSVDGLGHAENAYHIPGGIRIDRDAPLPPTPIDVQPRGWTNNNGFDLTFAMPPDLSGIAGVYYKVGA